MGLFGDLFKASDWNTTELQAIFSVMTAMGLMDGELDQDEKNIVGEMLTRLPGSESVNWEEFAKEAFKMQAEQAYSTLKAMRSNKREIAVAMLSGVAQADGNIDDKEVQFFCHVANVLNVKIPSSN